MNSKEIRRRIKKKSPKTYQKLINMWDYKMTHDVMRFIMDIDVYVDWKHKQYDGIELERRIWRLLKKARRLK